MQQSPLQRAWEAWPRHLSTDVMSPSVPSSAYPLPAQDSAPRASTHSGPCLVGEWEKEAGLCRLTSYAALWPACVGEAWRQGGWPCGGQGPEGQAGPGLRSPPGVVGLVSNLDPGASPLPAWAQHVGAELCCPPSWRSPQPAAELPPAGEGGEFASFCLGWIRAALAGRTGSTQPSLNRPANELTITT